MLMKIIDNSGATYGRVIKIRKAYVGAVILVSIFKTVPNSKIRKGQIFKAVIVNGSYNNITTRVRCEKSIVLVKLPPKGNDLLPIGSRIKGPICSKLRNISGMAKIISLSKRTI